MNSTDSKKEFITSENEHWYESKKTPGVFFPSVTTVLSIFPKGVGFNKYLTAQASWESSQEILKEAGKRGTNVHEATEFLENRNVLARGGYTAQEWEMLMGFVDWHNKNNPTTRHMEYGVVSDKLRTGGTIDRVYEIEGQLILLDVKTSSSIYENYWVQVATYAEMYEQLHRGEEISYTAILRLTDRKKSRYEYQLRSRSEWKEDFKIFKAIRIIWDYLNPNAAPKIVELPESLSLIKYNNEKSEIGNGSEVQDINKNTSKKGSKKS